MTFTAWLESITPDSQGEIAKKIGIARRTLQNQIYGTPKLETIVKIADTYGVNPHRALSELGYIKAHWLQELAGDIDAALLEVLELLDEVLDRSAEAVEAPDDEGVARAGVVHEAIELGA